MFTKNCTRSSSGRKRTKHSTTSSSSSSSSSSSTLHKHRHIATRQRTAAEHKRSQGRDVGVKIAFKPVENVDAIVNAAVESMLERKKFLPWVNNSCHFSVFMFAELCSYAKIGRPYWLDDNGKDRRISIIEQQIYFLLKVFPNENQETVSRESQYVRDALNQNTSFRNTNQSTSAHADSLDHVNVLVSESRGRRKIHVKVQHMYQAKSPQHICGMSTERNEVDLKWVRIREEAKSSALNEDRLVRAIKSDPAIRHLDYHRCTGKSRSNKRCPAVYSYGYISHDMGDIVVLALETPVDDEGYPTILVRGRSRYHLTCVLFCNGTHYKAVGLVGKKWYLYDDIPNSMSEIFVSDRFRPETISSLRRYNPWLAYYSKSSL